MRGGAMVAGVLVLAGALWVAPPREARGAIIQKVEVQRVELAYVLGRPGYSVRVTLLTGQAVEMRLEEGAETDRLLRLIDPFLRGQASLHAEMENNAVRGLVLSSPTFRPAR